MAEMHTIYDRASKRCLSLSKPSTILLINGLYDKNYPLDSEVDYHWTEHHDDELKKTLADTIITINHKDSYHVEIQMYPDEDIVLRVFEYGYRHALVNRNGKEVLVFPEPKILYLYEDGEAPDVQELTIEFGSTDSYTYKVPVVKYLKMSMEELNRRKLIVLIPFQLLRLRKAIEKERTKENMEQLKNLICHDIIESIEANVSAGNITVSVGRKLKRITLQLYRHIYEKYDEIEEAGVNQIVEEALVLDIDIIEAEHKKEVDALILDIDRIEAEHKKEVEALILDIDRIEAEHEKEKNALRENISQIEAEHEKETSALRENISQIEAEHEKETSALRENISQIEAEHEKEKSVLQENINRIEAEQQMQDEVIEQLTKKLQGLGISEEEILAMTRSASRKG